MPTIRATSVRSEEETLRLAEQLMQDYLSTLGTSDRLSMKLGFIGGIKIKVSYIFWRGSKFQNDWWGQMNFTGKA